MDVYQSLNSVLNTGVLVAFGLGIPTMVFLAIRYASKKRGNHFYKENPLEEILNGDSNGGHSDKRNFNEPDDSNFLKTLLVKADIINRGNAVSNIGAVSSHIQIHQNNKSSCLSSGEPGQAQPFKGGQYSDDVIAELLQNAIQNNKIDVFIQPVMKLPQRAPIAFEFYGRIRAKPGLYIPASIYYPIAEKENLLSDIDNAVLMACLETLRDQIKRDKGTKNLKKNILNITVGTLTDTSFMHQLLQFLGRYKSFASSLILEMNYQEFLAFSPDMEEIYKGLAEIGCSLSLSGISNDKLDLTWLRSLGIDILRVSGPALASEIKGNQQKLKEVSSNIEMLKEHGFDIIADYVENNQILAELLDLPVHYAQGYLLGKPDSPRTYNMAVYNSRFAA